MVILDLIEDLLHWTKLPNKEILEFARMTTNIHTISLHSHYPQ